MTIRKRAVICVDNPWDIISTLDDYSLMIVNPDSTPERIKYLLDHADWSVLIDRNGRHTRDGGSYPEEKVFWYTSGTTGDSKFCSFTANQVDNMARRIVQSYNITAGDRYVSIMPLWHAHGQGFYWATKLAGCQVSFLNIKKIRELESYNPTFITAIPDVLKLIENMNLPSLRFIRSASSAMPDDLYHKLKHKFDVPVVEAFGMTEALSHCFTNPLNGIQKVGTVGRPDGVEAKLDNGHLLIRGHTVCATDWYDTGDLAEVDKDGYYRILGRSREQINVRGIKVNPLSLEKQLSAAIDNIEQCVVFGESRVRIIYTGSCDAKTVTEFLASLGGHCRPDFVKQVDAIPSAPSGKVSRRWLLNHYSNG
jgi:long-subunit acyl-CoA synthetase (AMP-forming)